MNILMVASEATPFAKTGGLADVLGALPAALQALSRESRRAVVFVEVDDLEAVIAALRGAKIAVERHTTFYKSDEVTFEEPGGNLVTFAKLDKS